MIMRILTFLYGIGSYALGMGSLVYTAFWLIDLTPNALDAASGTMTAAGVAINLALLALFALQHSGMARPSFKAIWTRVIPAELERSTYILASAVAMAVFFYGWQPLGGDIWRVENGPAYVAILAAYGLGWAVLVSSTFCIDHFDLFGLRQVWLHLRGLPYRELSFVQRGLYRFVRHPIYVGWFLVIWISPVMTVSHLMFALGTTVYILWAYRIEERDLRAALPEYDRYAEEVPAFVPGAVSAPRPVAERA
ncbi:MAG: isoprenylcysteine carboxylmethyltransferase family protein [Pseudomonadota bacterium]